MKITFHSIRAMNFLQIGNEFETFNLEQSPFTAIIGKNGTGKSTMLDMITYVLYKKPYRKIKLGQLINNTNKKKMLVEIAFSVGASTYVVRRGDKPKVFEIYRDKKLIEPDPSIGDMQTYLETQILKQTYKTFCQINVIGKASYVQFMELETKDRRVIVEDLLDSNIYTVMAKLASADLKNLNEIDSDLYNKITIVEANIANTKKLLAAYQQDRQADIDKISDERKTLVDSIDSKKLVLDQLAEEIKQLIAKTDSVVPPQHVEALNNKIQELRTEQIKIEAVVSEREKINTKVDSLDNCPMCLQSVDHDHKQHVTKKNDQIIQQGKQKIEQIEQSLSKFVVKEQEYKVLMAETCKQQLKYSDLKRELTNIDWKIAEKDQQLERLTEKKEIPNIPDVGKLQIDLDGLNDQRNQLTVQISNTRAAIKHLGDDGIKAQLVNKYIPIINQTINNYLEKLEMFVEFNLDNEFNETINAINRDLFTYQSFSEGQKMRIDLAILLTWRYISQIRNSMTTNILILDEIADGSLDEEGMAEFMRILTSIPEAQNTFIISHKDQTIDLFDTIIKAETVGNFTRYTHL